MLKKIKLLSFFLLFVAFALAGLKIFYFSGELQIAKEAAPSKEILEQKRTHIQKDFYFAEDGTRRQTRIKSPSSLLIAIPKKSHMELVEKLDHLTCLMQEKIDPTMQNLRMIEADHGIYRYSNHEFLSEAVSLSLFQVEGNTLPPADELETPFLQGLASEVSLSFNDKTPKFSAKQFKAHVSYIPHTD